MMKFAKFNSNYEFVCILIEGVHDIPANSVQISDAQAVRLLNEQDGVWKLAGSEIIKTPLPEPVEPPQRYTTQFSVLDFRDRFTIDEQIAIRQAQLTDMEVGLVYDAFISAQFIDIADERVAQGIDLYTAKGLLEPDRKEALLAPELIPPPEAA